MRGAGWEGAVWKLSITPTVDWVLREAWQPFHAAHLQTDVAAWED